MSDIFSFNSDFENPTQQNEHTQSRNEYWSKKNERRQQLNEEYQQDLDRYSVNISQEDYNIIKDAIANADVPEDEAYRWACAMELNRQYDMPVAYAYQNLEQINAAKWGDRFTFTPKTNFKAIVDSGRLGANTLKMGRLGSKIMKAQMFGKTEYNNYLAGKVESVDDMMAEYKALEQESAELTDLEDRNFAIEAIKFGAQSAPYTAYVAGVGLLGGLLSGGVGTAAAFAVSMDNAAGLEYMRLRKAGSDVGDAAGFAILSGGLQALVETSLGNVAGALGKKSLGDLASQAVKNKITGNVFKRLAYNGTFKDLALRMGKEWLKENAEEGLEEVIQDLIEKGTDALAAELGGYEIEGLDAKTVARDAWENFRGGVMGSLILGLGPSVIKQKHDIKEFINVRNLAEVTPSLETFNKFTEDSTLWEGMSEEEKKNAQKTTWENAQARVEAAATAEAKKIAEGRDAAEGAEEGPAENEDGTIEANPVARDERGRLYTSDDVSTDDAGNVTGGTFVVGDKTKSENNRYGYIKYSQDAEGNITIQDFKMTNGREGLRAEAFDEFAREHPDVNIEWNPKAGEWEDAKQELIDANPSGKKNGLNYYSTTDLDNIAARKRVAEELRKNIHNVKRNADGSYTQTNLSNKQIAAGITLIESAARRMNMGLNEYVNKTFGSQIFGSREEFASASLAQGEDVNKKAGGMYQGVAQANWREVGQQIKAVIYAGEHADFSTWAHEMAHVYQNQLDGQLKADAEAAFNVQGGDWINSTYTFKDGRTMASAEAFAYGFQDWLETGKAENEQMRNIFQKFAEFIADCYNRLKKHLDFTPEIESVFNRLLDGDDTIMSKALKAAQEQDNEYRASLKRQAEEKQAAKEAEKEEAKKQAEAAREEASEGTDFENTQEEQSTEEIESKLDEVTNETEKTDNAIDNALENTNLTDEQKDEISEVLNDASTTVVEKAEAVTEAASSAYDDESEIDGYPELMFQLAGEPSIRRMAESEERERILTELDAAQLLDEKYKSMDANSRAARIRRATGWEKDASGQWKYELDDSVNRIKTEFFKANPGILSGTPYLLNLGDILEADELYKVFPYMQNVRVSFYSDPNAFRAVLTPQGIKVNTRYLQGMNGETGLKGVLAHEIQHIIQAMEFADSKGLQGADIEHLYKDMMNAMQAAGERKYDYDITSLQQGLDAYMKDAGEIEARNVARRIMMNADQRRMNTLASTEDVKRPEILFQAVKMDPAELTEAEQQIEYIRNKYEGTDEWLKAPNGADSNLYEFQWILTRTPSFKKWFGDWEKDPQNASKVVDENGEPLLMYHGTPLSRSKTTRNRGWAKDENGKDIYIRQEMPFTTFKNGKYNGLIFFTPDYDKAKAIADERSLHIPDDAAGNEEWTEEGYVYGVYLNARKPFNVSDEKLAFSILDKLDHVQAYNYYTNQLIDISKDEAKEILKGNNSWRVAETKEYLNAIKELGYDALQAKDDGYMYTAVMQPSQIKSATDNNGDFDVNNPDILFQDFTDREYIMEKIEAFKNKNIKNDAESMLFDLGELNSLASKGYGPKSNITEEIYRIKNTTLPQLAEELQKKGYKITIGDDFLSSENQKKNVIYFEKDGVQVSFHGNFSGLNYPEASQDEWNGLYKSWKYHTKEQQKEAKRIQDDVEEENSRYLEQLNEIVKSFILKQFKKNEIEPKYDGKNIHVSLDTTAQDPIDIGEILLSENAKFFVSLGQGINYSIQQKIIKAAKQYIEKKRPLIMYNSTERAKIYESRNYSNNITNNENVNTNILFQIAGEIGAENLDNSEVQEGVSRMQNLAIAKQMDADGKDAQAIRLATGWEKGGDGKWKYEIDDSKITVDFYAGMKVWEKGHPEFVQLRKRILKGETLTEAEQERFKTLYDEWDKTQDSKKDGEFFKLEEVLDFPELFKAYPTFKNIDVYIGNGEKKGVQGEYESDLNTISLYKEDYEKSPIDWTINAKSVLLHEIQHAIQYIEGFAKGGSDEQFEAISVDKLEQEIESLQKIANGEKKSRLYSQGDAYHRIEELQARIEEIEENALDGQVEVNGQVYENEFEAYRALAGEVEARNVQTRINFTPEERRNTLLAATEDVEPEDKIILFQTVYHGSGADFDKFDTENFGLSGEGSMSFGYGTYVTDSEEIARNYANRQAYMKDTYKLKPEYEDWDSIAYDILALDKAVKNGENFKQAKEQILRNLQNDLEKKKSSGYPQRFIEWAENDVNNFNSLNSVEDIDKLFASRGRYLYTVEIPDDGYFTWNQNLEDKSLKGIKEALKEKGVTNTERLDNLIASAEQWKNNPNATYVYGSNIYRVLTDYLGGQKEASNFLHSLGYAGIKYPAGTIHGNGNGAYNYVIFNDDDAKIVDKLLFQTQAELMDEAKTFDSWQEFMNYCQLSDDEQNAFENDEAWYKSFWEQANAITKEQEKKAEAEERRQEAEADTPEMVDRLFISYIKNNPEVVDNFVQQVSDIMEMDLGGDEWAHVDEEGGRERERYAVLQDYISAELRDGNWQTAIAKVQGGHEITDYIRKRLVTEMTDSYKARDFRNLYAAVMKEKRFTVDALDTRADELLKKLEKNPKRYFDILAPTEDVTVTTPQRRKEIAREMQNRDMAARIKAGSLKVDDEVINYLKSVEKKEKDLKKQEQQLTDKIQGLYNDVGNTGLQMLINTHEKLMEQKARLNNRNADTQRKIEKGLRMTDRYTRQTQDMTQTYHELERKFSDLKDSMVITSEVQQILDAQEQRRAIREEVARLTKERYLADETKKIRVNLVKQLFRKVPLDKVDFKQAQLIIAIQKLTMPNMIGGVNRWIGRNSPFLNAVLSRIVTDSEYKQRIVNYLEHVEKQTDTFRDFVESIRNAKSHEDFENWGVAEREYAIKYLPKENWVWELKLKEKARDLQESLHLDITQEKVERQVYDADGHPVEDDEGKPVMETAYQFKIGDEALNKLLQETLGDELFNRLMNSPMVEWSTQEMEELVARVNQIRDEGITMRAAKLEARKREAQKFIQQVADAVKDTGIVINDDDPPEVVEKKLEKINKMLGKNKNLKGTEASKDSGFKAALNRILHGYKDANVLRVCRIVDNQKEGVNTYLLYRKEDECYNKKMRSIMSRGEVVHKVMAANKITEGELAKSIPIEALGTKFTVDELLFFIAADKDFQLDENGNNDNYAATSRNAVCYGNMMSDTASQELKESWAKLDADMKEAIEKDLLTPEQRQLLSDNQLDTRPGTTAYIQECNRRWDIVLKAANDFLEKNPGYNALLEAIQADYADQYERMNEVSINEFNIGVNRVKCYVPLVRRESNGDTNENKVMEDLLAINGVGKSGVNKGMTQSRQTISPLHQRPVQAGLFRTWCDSVERTEHFIAYAPYVRLLNRVYTSRDAQYLRSTIEGRYGKGMLEYIDAYISEVANPNAQNTRSTGAELLHILRGKTAPAYLGWKASAIIKQGLTSPWPYMQFVNPAEYLAACFKCNNPKMWEAIQEKSVFMKNRRMDPMNDLVDEMAKNAKNKADKFWSGFTKTGMQGLEWIDWVCVAPGWYACYEKKYNQLQKASEARYNAKMAELEERNRSGNGEVLNPTQMETIARQELLEDIEVEAITYADDCTRQCQPSNRLTDLAPMFKDKNEFMRAFLQFQTSLNVIWQNLRYDMPYAVKNKEFGRIVGTVLGYTMAGIFMNSVMDGITSGADDDDDKDKQALRNLVFYATTQFTDAVPMIGSEITNMVDQAITGKRGFMNSGTDMTPTASKLFSAFTTAKKGNWQKAAGLTAEGIGLFLGAPVSGAKEINKLLGKPLSEGEVNIKKGISDVYGIAGDILEE